MPPVPRRTPGAPFYDLADCCNHSPNLTTQIDTGGLPPPAGDLRISSARGPLLTGNILNVASANAIKTSVRAGGWA